MLELKNVIVGYGKSRVLEGVSAAFEKGKLTSIIGVNGSGKSTLLKAALGLLPIEGGEVSVDREVLSALKARQIAQRIAYLAQGKNTPDMTVMQMVLHGRFPHLGYPRRYRPIDREIAREAMEQVGVAELAQRPLCTLSGGMRQIAYIAMALAQGTDYIFLDEPTTYLDIAHQLDVMRLLRKLAEQGKGVVAVMHDLPVAFEFSDEIVLLDRGAVAIQGAPKDLRLASAVRDVLGVQIKYSSVEEKFFYSR